MNKFKIVYSILLVFFGAFVFVYGGYDDSPGAQGLGVIIVISGIILVVRSKKRS